MLKSFIYHLSMRLTQNDMSTTTTPTHSTASYSTNISIAIKNIWRDV